MADEDRLSSWMAAYRTAWESNAPADIAALFSEDARYYTAPHREPWRGRDQIVAGWLGRRDEPGGTTFTWEPLVATADLAIIQGRTEYLTTDEGTFRNLWVIRFAPDGRCAEFTEWWMEEST